MGKRLLNLYCCQGGSAFGYELSGFDEITGVDKDPQPRYPYKFVQADAIEFVLAHGREFDFIDASPPCQLDSDCQVIRGNDHPDLILPTYEALEKTGVPYVIENVGGALPKLRDPVELCGLMFGMTRTYRHRYFSTGGWSLRQPDHPEHQARQTKLGRAPVDGQTIQAIGNFSGVGIIRQEWGVPWMNRDGIREAIPPAYTKYIGEQFLSQRG
jgi:DNA (cytosine-5)-methyltransferase 1